MDRWISPEGAKSCRVIVKRSGCFRRQSKQNGEILTTDHSFRCTENEDDFQSRHLLFLGSIFQVAYSVSFFNYLDRNAMEEWAPKGLHWLWFSLCKLFLKVNTPQLDLPPTTWFGKAPTQSPTTQYRSEATLATPLDCWAICSSEQGNPQSTWVVWLGRSFETCLGFFSGKCRVVHGHPLCVDASSFVCFKHIQKSFCIQYVRCIILYMFVGAHSRKCKWIHHFPQWAANISVSNVDDTHTAWKGPCSIQSQGHCPWCNTWTSTGAMGFIRVNGEWSSSGNRRWTT